MTTIEEAIGRALRGDVMPRDIIDALDAAGIVIVPKEPTQEVINAGFELPNTRSIPCCPACGYDGLWPPDRKDTLFKDLPNIYRRLIAAAAKGPP